MFSSESPTLIRTWFVPFAGGTSWLAVGGVGEVEGSEATGRAAGEACPIGAVGFKDRAVGGGPILQENGGNSERMAVMIRSRIE